MTNDDNYDFFTDISLEEEVQGQPDASARATTANVPEGTTNGQQQTNMACSLPEIVLTTASMKTRRL
jgi:hypothetical protein